MIWIWFWYIEFIVLFCKLLMWYGDNFNWLMLICSFFFIIYWFNNWYWEWLKFDILNDFNLFCLISLVNVLVICFGFINGEGWWMSRLFK